MKNATEKTNVMRILSQHKIAYTSRCYTDTDAISGVEVATALGQDPNRMFKTLVTVGHSGTHYVFMVPAPAELDLKKAAQAVHEKSIEMIKSRDLLPLTGYIHGGCSPIGMKKQFRTVLDESAMRYETIYYSAGKIGYQVETTVADLQAVVPVTLYALTV